MLPLAALGLVSVIQGMRSCVRQLVAQRRFLESLALTGRLPSHPGVWLVDDDRPQALCAGHLRPRVYVPTRAVRFVGAARPCSAARRAGGCPAPCSARAAPPLR